MTRLLDRLNLCLPSHSVINMDVVGARIEQDGTVWRLNALQGEQLSAVTFVQDYVQLHFDGPFVTTYTLPEVHSSIRGRLRSGDDGYRDALCELIAKRVEQASVEEHVRLEILFEGGEKIVVPLQDPKVVEAVMFTDGPPSKFWAVW